MFPATGSTLTSSCAPAVDCCQNYLHLGECQRHVSNFYEQLLDKFLGKLIKAELAESCCQEVQMANNAKPTSAAIGA